MLEGRIRNSFQIQKVNSSQGDSIDEPVAPVRIQFTPVRGSGVCLCPRRFCCFSRNPAADLRTLTLSVAALMCALLLPGGPVIAQNTGETTSPPAVAPERVNDDQLTALRKSVTEDETLSADLKKSASEQIDAAVTALRNEQRHQQTLQTLKADAETAVDERAKIEKQLAVSPPEFVPGLPADATKEQIQAEVSRAETEVAEAAKRRTALDEEITRRTTRRTAVPDLITQSRAALAEVNLQLAAKAPDGEPSNITKTRRQSLLAKRQALTAELELLEQEGPLYEATAPLMTARRDSAAQGEAEAGKRLEAWKKLLATALRNEAEQQAKAARLAAVNAHPDVRGLADRNKKLSGLNQETVSQLEKATRERDETRKQVEKLTTDFEELTRRAEAAQFTHAIGVLLRTHRATLPSTDRFRDRLAADRFRLESRTDRSGTRTPHAGRSRCRRGGHHEPDRDGPDHGR